MTSPRVILAPADSARWSTSALTVIVLLLGGLGYLFGRALPRAPTSPDSRFPSSALVSQDRAPAPILAAAHTAEDASAAAAEVPAASLWQEQWTRLLGAAGTPSRDRQLVRLLEDLARTDPQKALALAAAEANWRLRDELRDAALRGWASIDPQAAGDSALLIRVEDRRRAVAAVLEGAAAQPESAVQLALHLCSADPDLAGDHGHSAISALVKAGDFEAAARFGTEVGADKFPFLLKSAFYQWARHQPDRAFAAAETITDPVLRHQALGQAFFGWSQADAKSLAEHALKLPPGDTRAQAFAEALPRWIEKDPVAATEWMQTHDSGADFDPGVGALAHHQTLVTRQPAKAMAWADTISDPRQRAETLRSVLRQWAEKDNPAARLYIDQLPNPEDLVLLADELRDMTP